MVESTLCPQCPVCRGSHSRTRRHRARDGMSLHRRKLYWRPRRRGCGGATVKRMKYMSPSTTPTVYAAELKRLVLALQILLDIHTAIIRSGKCAIFADNQAALQALWV